MGFIISHNEMRIGVFCGRNGGGNAVFANSTQSTTTTTTSGTTTTTTCATNAIEYSPGSGELPTSVTFSGTPTGPYTVVFVDQSSDSHDLTGIIGDYVTLPWTFNVANPIFAGIPNVVGVYTFTKGDCEYEVTIPIQIGRAHV